MAKKKALIYCRVSSERQAKEGHGNESQEQRCRRWADDREYEVVRVFVEDGVSGALFDRPMIKELLAFLDDHPTESYVVIFDDLARLARDIQVHIKLKAEFFGRGAKLECLNFSFDDSPEGEFAEMVIASSNQLYRKQNRRQVIQKMKARLEDGFWPFCMPPGLVNYERTKHCKVLKPDGSPEAEVRKAAIEKFASGELQTQDDVRLFVKAELKEKGIQSKFLSHHGVQSLLKNPLYYGMVEYKPWNIPLAKGQHDGLVDPELYPVVLARFDNSPKVRIRRDYTPDFPLRGLVRCARCHGPFTGSWSTGRYGKKYPKYDCKELGCSMRWKTIHRDKLHPQFLELLKGVAPDKPIVDLTIEVLNDVWNQSKESYETTKNENQTKIGEIDEEITNLKARLRKTNDDILVREYEADLKEKLTQKESLEGTRFDRHYTDEELGTATKRVLQTLEDPVGMWQSPDWHNRRIIALMYFEDKLYYDRDLGFGTATLSRPVALMKELSSQKVPDVEMGRMTSRVVKKLLNVYKRSQFFSLEIARSK